MKKIIGIAEIIIGVWFLLNLVSDIQVGFGLLFLLNGIKTLLK